MEELGLNDPERPLNGETAGELTQRHLVQRHILRPRFARVSSNIYCLKSWAFLNKLCDHHLESLFQILYSLVCLV